ncbi:MAG: TIGR02444 family protein, partial [Geminicoccaceae bacterium]
MDWPESPFWDYSLSLYGRPGVEQACLELQRRHGLNVNLLLFAFWLADRGV